MKELIFLVFLLPRLEEREEVESSVFDDLSLTWLGRLLDFRPDDVEELSVRRLAAGLGWQIEVDPSGPSKSPTMPSSFW